MRVVINTPKYFTRKHFKLSGIYFFMHNSQVVYIGKSTDLIFRVFGGDVISRIKYDSIRFIFCDVADLNRYEKRWIIRFRPKYNTIHLFKWIGSFRSRRKKVAINLKQHN